MKMSMGGWYEKMKLMKKTKDKTKTCFRNSLWWFFLKITFKFVEQTLKLAY